MSTSAICPHCGARLPEQEIAAGWCETCGKRIPAGLRREETGAPPGQHVGGPAAGAGRRLLPLILTWGVPLAVLGILALAGVLYSLWRSDVWIYVDNGGPRPLKVSVDGSREITVAPNRYDIVKCQSGPRRITVTEDGRAVFDETRELAAGDPRKYLLNPGATNRYCVSAAEYSLYGVPSYRTSVDEQDEYRQLAAEVRLLEPAEWIDEACNACEDVLEKPPPKLKGTHQTRRKVLGRLTHKDYETIAAAQHNKSRVSSADCARLKAAVERVLAQN